MKTTTPLRNSIHRSPRQLVSLLSSLLIACALFSQRTRAVNPPPDGGYPGFNTAEGQTALFSLDTSTGLGNTAVGWSSLKSSVSTSFNTAIGAGVLLVNTFGYENTAIGAGAMLSNTTGIANSAIGTFALFNNINGVANTAAGRYALFNNTSGDGNTAVGSFTLQSNTDGLDNTAVGSYALNANTGTDNTAIGVDALTATTGSYNTAVGTVALASDTTGINNIALGYLAGFKIITANNVICIGHLGEDVSNSCFIGNIRDVQTQNADAIPVAIDSHGQLGTANSSRRFKNEIKPMDESSEAILALKPVSFHYKNDKTGTAQFGLVAEDVANVNPDLVMRDRNGEIYTVRYDAVNAMLLNEFLKEHRRVEKLQKQIEALTAGLEKVSAQLQARRPTGQVVLQHH